jgi:3-phosphoshikimate 1-carboxyvinyltransferase
MGADITTVAGRDAAGEPVADLRVRAGPLTGIEVAGERAPSMIDEYPVLAVAAAFAHGTTRMRGLAELRVKESDRLAAIVEILTGAGIEARAGTDDLLVVGAPGAVRGGCSVATRLDHRLAMSALVMGLAAGSPVAIDDAAPIATSFTGFAGIMRGLGAVIGPPGLPRRTG